MDFNQSTYNLEFFNFTPEQIAAERDSLVLALIGRAVKTTIQKIETPATTALLDQSKDAVISLMMQACQSKLDSLREMDKVYFEVPPHVLQIKDFELEQRFTSEEEEAKAAQVKELKLRYRQNLAMLAELKAEEDKYKDIEPLVQQELEMHKQIYAACANSDIKKIYEFAMRVAKDHKHL
ncbi:hypothetical protein AWZ03_003667 [Drosophila navojoa]|uniref:Uncharacterized protein n=1 Tax=Drosophila navojoa TaxID=7232 RepID=A0A484BQ87_DRONA|nr:uncharacterized protein LOC115562000 [Drosophila navojoa]TDG49891.1 hypothetical protein AWZ03_003667 [Drosophila navojoa]